MYSQRKSSNNNRNQRFNGFGNVQQTKDNFTNQLFGQSISNVNTQQTQFQQSPINQIQTTNQSNDFNASGFNGQFSNPFQLPNQTGKTVQSDEMKSSEKKEEKEKKRNRKKKKKKKN